jgi:hypothetical protein
MNEVLDKIARLIREEFEEAPGLRMTVHEASQFWALDEKTCAHALARLHETGFLTKGLDERYRQTYS